MLSLNRAQRLSKAAKLLLLWASACSCIAASTNDEELLKELALPSLWIKTLDARTWSGYKDNVLLANQNTESSPLLGASLDGSLLRLPVDGWESMFLFSGEYTRYFNLTNIDHEADAIAQAQFKKKLADNWKPGLAAEYFYFDQVFDNSIVSTQLLALPVDGHTFTLRPSLEKPFAEHYHFQAELVGTRQIFGQFIDNYWEFGPKLTLGREYGHKSDLSISYAFNDRLHDTMPARDAGGNIEPGRGLQFWGHELFAVWRHNWDAEGRLRTTTKLSIQRNEDNGGGFYNFWRPFLMEQVRYRRPTWELRTEARVSYYQWDAQRIDITSPSPVRHKAYFRFDVRAEKSLAKTFKLFAQYTHDEAISNLEVDQYSMNSVLAGFDWEF